MKRRIQVFLFVLLILTAVCAMYAEVRNGVVVSRTDVLSKRNDAGTSEIHMLINKEQTGDPRFYMGSARFQPGASVAEHVHQTSVEIVYVISGAGIFTMSGKRFNVKAGTALYIPENTPHSFSNSGKESVEIVQVYSPGGPEERFKAWK
jgi:quercetin dioxygenase-like cupin family protein